MVPCATDPVAHITFTIKGQITMQHVHEFHIPVMGTGFTIDSPIKVAKYGIASVVSIGDDELCETMRKYYMGVYGWEYAPIRKWEEDYRARRITGYLNLLHRIVSLEFSAIQNSAFSEGSEIQKYFALLPDNSPLKAQYTAMLACENASEKETQQDRLRAQMIPGSIDVNIMTKLDRQNYDQNGKLMSDEDSDALSALRGFAHSDLDASIIFSAGFNRRLYAYLEKFDDFFPDATGHIRKRIILKVSDYRSSLTQGKFLAKKGVWVYEHRIESGLNCGGHAFATDGLLMGPILDDFKNKRDELATMLVAICNEALQARSRVLFPRTPDMRITVQGGIGTANEQRFLFDHYQVHGTGWATPFLLVPEATTLDDETRAHLAKAEKDDLYLSDISPLGVPFNTVRGTKSEAQKLARIADGKPGSPCPKGYLVSNLEFTKKPICSAATTFQKRKLAQVEAVMADDPALASISEGVVGKACLCEDLAAGALIAYGIENKRPRMTAVCPGPNLAYFSNIVSLADMVGHIYGRVNLLNATYRSNLFINELAMYIQYLRKEIQKSLPVVSEKQVRYFQEFRANLNEGIQYYKGLVPKFVLESKKYHETMREELLRFQADLDRIFVQEFPTIFAEYQGAAS
jgi:hypothetical protein